MKIPRFLIYISNARIPSEKANTYQSFCMCEAFANSGFDVEFWHPARRLDYSSSKESIKRVFLDYDIESNFKLLRIWTIDSTLLQAITQKYWFLCNTLLFSLNVAQKILRKRLNPDLDLIYTRDEWTYLILNFLKRIKLLQIPVIFEAHRFSTKIHKFMQADDKIVVINNQLKRLYEDKSKQILVAHDGVSSKWLDAFRVNIQEEKTKSERKFVLYTGNLFPWKGVYILANSTFFLNENIEVFLLGGSPECRKPFEEYIRDKKQIHVLGHQKRRVVQQWLKKADVLILPNSRKYKMSEYTSPLKLFEYMATGKPIIASRIPSLQEVLKDKQNAILFHPDDPEDLAKKIIWVLNNDCTHIVKQASIDVSAYTWEKRSIRILNHFSYI